MSSKPKSKTSQRKDTPRHDFKDSVKNTLRQRAGDKCCLCGKPTSGPSSDPEKGHNIGEAAHITAAAEGGPRYDKDMDVDVRSSAENGIWLCCTCHKIVDGDVIKYTVEKLKQHKKDCEEQAEKAFGAPEPNITASSTTPLKEVSDSQVNQSPHPSMSSSAGTKREAPDGDTTNGNINGGDPSPPPTKRNRSNSTQGVGVPMAEEVTMETHSVMSSNSMSDEDFFKLLKSKGVNQKDLNALSEYGITAAGFLQFDAEDFDDIELTGAGKKLVLKISNELKGQCDQPSSETDKTRAQEGDEHTINEPIQREQAPHSSGPLRTLPETQHQSISPATTGKTRLRTADYNSIYTKLEPSAAKWRDIGRGLKFKKEEMDNIQSNPMLLMQGPPGSYLGEMLSKWLQWAHGDGRGSEGFATKESLRAALLSVNLGELAQQI